jgi:ABC-2 type transport system permease protein
VVGFPAVESRAPVWIRRASFTQNLSQVRQEVFNLDQVLTKAGASLPLLDQRLAADLTRKGQQAEANDFAGALAALGGFVVVSSFVFFRRLRPE